MLAVMLLELFKAQTKITCEKKGRNKISQNAFADN